MGYFVQQSMEKSDFCSIFHKVEGTLQIAYLCEILVPLKSVGKQSFSITILYQPKNAMKIYSPYKIPTMGRGQIIIMHDAVMTR